MHKYKSFEEYIHILYGKKISEELAEFVVEVDEGYEVNGVLHHFNDCYVNNIYIKKIVYNKSHLDNLEFTVYFSGNYDLMDTKVMPPIIVEKENGFSVNMTGTFEKGFKFKDDNMEISDGDEKERFTNGLVPVISNDELDKYASKFLKVFCPEALKEPIKLDVIRILKEHGLTFYYAPLEDDVLGKIFFAEDKVMIYKDLSIFDNEPFLIVVKPGTILINFKKAIQRGNGSVNNTLIHEAVHWFFHRNYFELRQHLDNEKKCMVCYRAENRYDNKDINWMESQARRLAPRILMPKDTSERKLKEVTKEVVNISKERGLGLAKVLERIVQKFASAFGVSLASAKIRIKELGYTQFDGVCNYDSQGNPLEKFVLPPHLLTDNQSFIIDPTSLEKLIKKASPIKIALKNEKLVYINHMVVANNTRYVKNGRLTSYALEHPEECALIFTTIPSVETTQTEDGRILYLASSTGNRKNKIEVEPSQYTKVLSFTDVNFNHFMRHKKDIPEDLAGTIKYHYEKCKENEVFFCTEDFAMEADISDSSIRSYMKGNKPKDRIRVLKIGLAMSLSTPYLLDLLNKYDDNKRNITLENILFNNIIYGYGQTRASLEEVYYELKKENQEGLLEMSSTWLESHGIKH